MERIQLLAKNSSKDYNSGVIQRSRHPDDSSGIRPADEKWQTPKKSSPFKI